MSFKFTSKLCCHSTKCASNQTIEYDNNNNNKNHTISNHFNDHKHDARLRGVQ